MLGRQGWASVACFPRPALPLSSPCCLSLGPTERANVLACQEPVCPLAGIVLGHGSLPAGGPEPANYLGTQHGLPRGRSGAVGRAELSCPASPCSPLSCLVMKSFWPAGHAADGLSLRVHQPLLGVRTYKGRCFTNAIKGESLSAVMTAIKVCPASSALWKN